MKLGTLYSETPLCPFTHRVLIASRELDAPVEVVYGESIPAAIRESNIPGTWPIFVAADGSEPLQDSSAIVEHLIAHSGARGDAYRSDGETLAKLDTLVRCISKVILAGQPRVQKEFREKLDRALADVEVLRAAAGGAYLGGDRFSQADGHVTPFLYRLPFLAEVRNHVPRIFFENNEFDAWVDRLVNRASFREIAPERHALRRYYADRARYGKPMKVGRLHHAGFRGMWEDLTARVMAIAGGPDTDNAPLSEARDLCYLLFRTVALHAKFENLVLFPVLQAAANDPGLTTEAVEQHRHEEGEMNALLERFDRALGETPGQRRASLVDLASACASSREEQLAHLDHEEARLMPVLFDLDVERHVAMIREAYEMCILERPHLIGVLASYMPIDATLSLVDSLLHAVEPDSAQWRTLLRALHRSLDAEQWLKLARRFEDVVPTSLLLLPGGYHRPTVGEAARALQAAVPVERIKIP